MRKLLTALLAAALAFGVTASAASAHPAPTPKCSGETWAVVSAEGDAAMAELVAWHLSTRCIVEPDDAKRLVSATQQTVVLGGTAAVPDSDVDGLNVEERLWGADRVETGRSVIAWIDRRNRPNDGATTATIDGTDPSTFSLSLVEGRLAIAEFVVGRDIAAGVWQFSKNTVRGGGSSGRYGESCVGQHHRHSYRIVAEGAEYRGTDFDGYPKAPHPLDRYKTKRFVLRHGDRVELRIEYPSDNVCEIVWRRDND